MYSDSVLYAVSLFGWYIVLLLSVHVSVGVYCTDSGLCGLFSPPQKTANTVPLHTYQRMFFASAIAATDKCLYNAVAQFAELALKMAMNRTNHSGMTMPLMPAVKSIIGPDLDEARGVTP